MSMSLRSRSVRFAIAAAALGLVAGSAAAVSAAVGGGGAARDGGEGRTELIREQLSGYEETPLALSTSGHGTFRAMMTDAGIKYTLSYADLSGGVSQAHIHFGAPGQSGGISVFLCTNLGNGPVGRSLAQPLRRGHRHHCRPTSSAPRPGHRAREYEELLAAIRAGTAYVNVHSSTYGGGEIRGQIETGHITEPFTLRSALVVPSALRRQVLTRGRRRTRCPRGRPGRSSGAGPTGASRHGRGTPRPCRRRPSGGGS